MDDDYGGIPIPQPVPSGTKYKNTSLRASLKSSPTSGSTWLGRRPTNGAAHHRAHSTATLIVEAVMLTTKVEASTFSRPIYMSPTAIATGLLPAVSCDFDDLLHVFTGTRVQFEVVLRVVGPQAIRIFCHEALIMDGEVEELLVKNAGVVEASPDTGTAFLLTLPPNRVIPRGALHEENVIPKKRIQIFDQERRLLFTKEWQMDTGILNDDAISWLRDSHYSIPLLGTQRPDNGPDVAVLYSVISPDNSRSRSESISGSFINLDGELPYNRSLSRSDSIITLRSPLDGDLQANNSKTIDLFQQMGYWLYGTRVGQLMANSYDPRENSKTLYSPSPIWLMGQRFNNDRIGSLEYSKAISVGPINKIIRLSSNIPDWRAPSGLIVSKLYYLQEGLTITCLDPEAVLPQLASWLEGNDWQTDYPTKESTTFTLLAQHNSGKYPVKLELSICPTEEGKYLLLCSISCDWEDSLFGKTTFVDVLSELLAISATLNRDEAAVEFMFLRVSGCNIEIGPQPNSLVQIYPGGVDLPQLSPKRTVLLWSEHIHDWILREISQDQLTMEFVIRSPFTNLDPMPIVLTRAAFYFFADSSMRFALSHSTYSSWFCFRSASISEFTEILSWLPNVLRRWESRTPSREMTPPAVRPSSPLLVKKGERQPIGASNQHNLSEQSGHSTAGGMDDFIQAFESCFWFTYRRDFPRLSPSILSSDAGFGCMLRAGQSMMAEGASRILCGPNRRLNEMLTNPDKVAIYKQVRGLFYLNYNF